YTDYSNWSSDDKLDHYAWSHFNAINRKKPKIVNTFLKKNILYRYNKPDNTGLNDIVHFETRTFNIEGNTINNAIFEAPGFNVFTSTAEITFENKHFTAPEYIYANEKITLKGNITCDPGVEVTIVAGEEIVVEEGAEIGETISLMVGLPSVCNSTRIRPTPIDKSFCENREQYKANSTMAKNDFVPIQNTVLNRSVIYPNPTATGSFMVETYLEQESFITINVYDFEGKKLLNDRSNETLLKGNHKTPFDNTYLEPGIYLVEVETNQGKKTYKLIKN
ncbi:MAG: T9SS type A sorting domain-containing protein, partial [Bacteroidota bacterium]